MPRHTLIQRTQDKATGLWTVTGERPTTSATCICGAEVERVEIVTNWDSATGKVPTWGWGVAQGTCPACGTLLIDGAFIGSHAIPKDRTTWKRVRRERERQAKRS